MPSVLEALNLGLEYQRAGRLPEAETVYRAVLTAQPDSADALHLLGVIACQTGKAEACVELVQQAIRLRPSVAQFHNTQGSALAALQRREEARFAFEWALQLAPDFPEAHVNFGNLLQDLDQPEEALAQYQCALERCSAAEIHNNMGNALRRLNRLDEAISAFRQALRLKADYPEAYVNLAAALLDSGAREEAARCCEEAIRLEPRLAAAHSNFAAVLLSEGRLEKAEAAAREALRLRPEYPEAHHNLADALRAQGKWQAIPHYRQALRLQPGRDQAFKALSGLVSMAADLSKQGRFEGAEALCREVLAIAPEHAESHRVLGNVYYRQRRLEEAFACYNAVLASHPDDAGAHWNRALLLLLRGEFEEGWQEYEWRWKRPDARRPELPQPRWNGEPLDGRRVLIWAEQGLGDTIQFLRYLPMIQQAGGKCIFQCPPALVKWLGKRPELGQVVDAGLPTPEAEFHSPLLSLPRIFHTTLKNIPAPVPYLSVDPQLIEVWRERMKCILGYRVGLVWTGSAQNSENAARSIPPAGLNDLFGLPGIGLVCLQQGSAPRELPIHYLDVPDEIEETAAMIMNLDLVISVDTMIAHLAGALGRPVWNLLSFAADFRWLLDREDSPWYPTMRLFRQPRPGAWGAVIRQVAASLQRYAPTN